MSRRLQDLDGFPFARLLHAFHNDNIVFLEPGGDELQAVHRTADLHSALLSLGRAVLRCIHYPDVGAFGVMLQSRRLHGREERIGL